ncbi:multidrug/spermidine efflux SMR transporter subunit MdtI [Providencia rettgeri]|nr:multidrug/spermidine efflux SMR transporter subunit MdtI [Providencia rettgeri]
MASHFEWWHAAFLILAVILEIAANILLKMSNGFKRYWIGILPNCGTRSLQCISASSKGIELSIAYALWGAFGIIATVAAGWILFNQRLNYKGWGGIVLLLLGNGSHQDVVMLVTFCTVALLATFVNPSHILMYAQGINSLAA